MALHTGPQLCYDQQRHRPLMHNSTSGYSSGYASRSKDVSRANVSKSSVPHYHNRASSVTPSSTSSSSSGPDIDRVEEVIQEVYGHLSVTIQQTQRLAGHLHSIWLLALSNNQHLILKARPARGVRYLRHERDMLRAEVHVIQRLSNETSITVPELVGQGADGSLLNGSYILTKPIFGQTLSSVSPSLSVPQRKNLDVSLGSHLRTTCTLTGDSFGRVGRVLSGQGFSSWRDAFAWELEAAIRDAEEMLLMLPYEDIRRQARYHDQALDQVHTPRLVRMNAADESKILVNPDSMQITGVLDWGDTLWGDPLSADVFALDPSADFLLGFGISRSVLKSARPRILLYAMYQALVAIVKQAYRPVPGRCDMEERRRLTAAMAELSQISGVVSR